MIFTPHHAELVMALPVQMKWQTRRLEKPGDEPFVSWGSTILAVERNGRSIWRVDGRLCGVDWYAHGTFGSNAATGTATYRQPSYAVQAGRGQPQLGRFRITAIRRQRLQDITDDDAIMEGVFNIHPRQAFAALWDGINKKRSDRWEANPAVWALTIERLFWTEDREWQPMTWVEFPVADVSRRLESKMAKEAKHGTE